MLVLLFILLTWEYYGYCSDVKLSINLFTWQQQTICCILNTDGKTFRQKLQNLPASCFSIIKSRLFRNYCWLVCMIGCWSWTLSTFASVSFMRRSSLTNCVVDIVLSSKCSVSPLLVNLAVQLLCLLHLKIFREKHLNGPWIIRLSNYK